jgi:Glycosyl transferase 4-like domain
VKVLLVTTSLPPDDGGLRLPALGIETHVLVPDDAAAPSRNGELRRPTQAFVHRIRSLGPGLWLPVAAQAAVRLVSREGIDAVVTTGPPSLSLVGAAVKRVHGIPWLADASGTEDQGIAGLVARYADGVVGGDQPEELAERLWSLE